MTDALTVHTGADCSMVVWWSQCMDKNEWSFKCCFTSTATIRTIRDGEIVLPHSPFLAHSPLLPRSPFLRESLSLWKSVQRLRWRIWEAQISPAITTERNPPSNTSWPVGTSNGTRHQRFFWHYREKHVMATNPYRFAHCIALFFFLFFFNPTKVINAIRQVGKNRGVLGVDV